MKSLRVGLFYNLRRDYPRTEDCPLDVDADWDIPDTITEIVRGLRNSGHEVIDVGDPQLLVRADVRQSLDIVFSICEMRGYRFRESIVPSICELLKIPYVFSPPDTMMISLDKNLCNLLVQQAGCNVPESYLVKSGRQVSGFALRNFPYIVKPSCEGSGMGITERSVVYEEAELASQVELTVQTYAQPALVQRFMPGREFTIGVVENDGCVMPLHPLELHPRHPAKNFTYNYSMKESADQVVTFDPLNNEPDLAQQLRELARQSFEAIGCRDAARVDIRLSEENVPYFLEINPLPHLHPDIGDFCRSASAFGWSYDTLITIIVKNASIRYGLNMSSREKTLY